MKKAEDYMRENAEDGAIIGTDLLRSILIEHDSEIIEMIDERVSNYQNGGMPKDWGAFAYDILIKIKNELKGE